MPTKKSPKEEKQLEKFVTKLKKSKKLLREENAADRANWGDINPVTKVIPSKKLYNRKKLRKGDFQ